MKKPAAYRASAFQAAALGLALGLAVWPNAAFANDSSHSGAYLRGEVNTGGGGTPFAESDITANILVGSVGVMDSPILTPVGSFRLMSGLQGGLYYPESIPDAALSLGGATVNSFNISFPAPASGVKSLTQPRSAGAYEVRFRSRTTAGSATTSITTTTFNTATRYTGTVPAPASPGDTESFSMTGLDYNTFYRVAVRALEEEPRGRTPSYEIAVNALEICTLAPVPTMIDLNILFGPRRLRARWNPHNTHPTPHSITFEAQVSEDNTFLTPKDTKSITSSNPNEVTLDFTDGIRTGRTYYVRARARNRANVWSEWSTPITFGSPPATPTLNAVTVAGPTSANLSWNITGADTFQAEVSLDGGPFVAQSAATLRDNEVVTLNPNSSYSFRVQAFEGTDALTPSNTQSLVTGITMPTSPATAVHQTSITYTWSHNPANGTGPFSYWIGVSSDNFLSTTTFREVAYPDASVTLEGLLANTAYTTKIIPLNRNATNLYSDAPRTNLFAAAFTKVMPPLGLLPTVPLSPRHQVSVGWTHGENNPLTTAYRAVLSETPGGPALATNTTPVGGTTTLFSAPTPAILANKRYYVGVQALSANVANPNSAAVEVTTTTLPVPPQLTGLNVSTRTATLTWANNLGLASNSPETQYRLSWENAFGPVDQLTTVPGATTAQATLLQANTTYTFTVEALDIGTWPAQTVSTTVPTLAFEPINLEVGLGQTSLQLDWASNGNPAGTIYRVSHADNPAFTGAFETETAFLTYNFTGLTPNRLYYLGVQAINHAGIVTAITGASQLSVHTNPAPALITAFGKPSSTQLRLNWGENGNQTGTLYEAQLGSGAFESVTPGTLFKTYSSLSPNTLYSFSVKTKAASLVPAADVTATSSTYTRAEDALPSEVFATINLTTLSFKFSLGNNPETTEYAMQLEAFPGSPPGPRDGLYFDRTPANPEFLAANSSVKVWRRLSDWGVPEGTPGVYLLRITELNLSERNVMKIYVRNQQGQEEGPTITPPIEPKSGMPVVSLNTHEGTFNPTDSMNINIYDNRAQQTFEALGSGHFNFRYNTLAGGLADLQSNFNLDSAGWNGRLEAGQPCSNDAAVVPLWNAALSGFCAPEGVYYLHILGTELVIDNISGLPISVRNPIPSTTSFRVLIDRTAPAPGTIRAFADGFEIPSDHTERLGFQRPGFEWFTNLAGNGPGSDAGVVQSPILRWNYTFSASPAATPVKTTGTIPVVPGVLQGSLSHVNGAIQRLTININDLGALPEEETYYLKIVGYDKANNWTTAPVTFIYNFKKDIDPPEFIRAEVEGSRLPVPGIRYVTVRPDAPIRLVFSEQMNFDAANSLTFYQTHDALGNRLAPHTPIAFNVTEEVGPGGPKSTTTMVITPTATLPRGARFVMHTSTTSTRDLGGNRLTERIELIVHTLLDPSVTNTVKSEDDKSWLVIPPMVFGPGERGVAFDDKIAQASSAMGAMVRRANGAMSRRSGGGFQPIIMTKEVNLYDGDGNHIHGNFAGNVRLVFDYTGLEETDPETGEVYLRSAVAGNRIRIQDLVVHRLDDRTGAWIKVPGVTVDRGQRTVSVDINHFSVYALAGAPNFNLAGAHPYPVPYRASKHSSGITFDLDGASLATVKIFTMDGRLIKTLSDNTGAGFISWNPVTTDSGEKVAADVYLYVIENDQQRKVGKIMVIP